MQSWRSSQRCSVGSGSGLCAGHLISSTPILAICVFIVLILCTGALSWWNMLVPFVPLNGNLNAEAYKANRYNCVLPNFWQKFGKDPHMGMIIRCLHTFGRVENVRTTEAGLECTSCLIKQKNLYISHQMIQHCSASRAQLSKWCMFEFVQF